MLKIKGDSIMKTTVSTRKEALEFDEDGYLMNIDEWDVNVAEQLAREEGIRELTGNHWKLITAIRFHYERYGESPLCRDILVESGFTKKDMYELFPPLGYRSAFKVAGLPKPIEC
jgi:tRNA 2-thiouridine synthesizing protein E